MFVVGRVIQFLVQLTSNSEEVDRIDPAGVTLLFTFIVFTLIGTINHCNFIWKQDEWVSFYNELVTLRNKMLDNQYKSRLERIKSTTVVILGTVRAFGMIVSAIKFPKRSQYVYSVLPTNWQTPRTFAIFVPYIIHITVAYCSSMSFVVGTLLIYYTTVTNAFKMR
ncbi:unnamed protein product [Allacma fusca]|uniref:Uncharacterized protein n=1 Tax=Allacma fusca TaxID=39272 RepID=A0A8J2PMS2_9HEXA|nr:unnamed protein product [Allacma fusca]